MPDYTNRLETLKARRRASAATALILTVLGSLLAGIGGFGFMNNTMTEHYEDASPFGVAFRIGFSLLVIGIILFIVEAIIAYKLKRLAKKSDSGAAINKDNAPADNER